MEFFERRDAFIAGPRHVTEQPVSSLPLQSSTKPNHDLAIVSAVVVLAALARLPFLGKSFWLDEGISVGLVRGLGSGRVDTLPHLVSFLWHAGELNMAPYYVLLKIWLHLGTSAWWIRLLSVIPGVATIPLIYVLGKRAFGARTGLIAAFLLAIHGAHVAYSQEARSYALCVFLCTASYLAFLKAVESASSQSRLVCWGYWLLYSLLITLAIYSHFFAALLIPAQFAALLWLPRETLRPWQIVASAVLIVLLVCPVAVFVLTQNSGQIGWIESTAKQIPRLIGILAGNRIVFPVYLALWWIAIRDARQRKLWSRRSLAAWRTALIVGWLFVPIVLVLMACIAKPILQDRYLLICVPAAALLAGQGLHLLQGRWLKPIAALTVVLSLAGVGYAYSLSKENWRGATDYVRSEARPGDAITVAPEWSRWPFAYYWEQHPGNGTIADLPPETDHIEAWVLDQSRVHDRILVIVYARRRDGYPETRALQHALARQYHLEQRRDLKFVSVEIYRKKAD